MSNSINIGLSLDLINRHHQEPNRNRCESKYYWEELYPLIASAGFDGIEIPYDPYWMFRGGTGVPMTKYCIEAKYSSVTDYVAYLKTQGIGQVAGVHIDPTMFMRNESLEFYFGASGHFAGEAVRHAAELGCDYVSVTATPPFGLVKHYHGQAEANEFSVFMGEFLKRTEQALASLAETAAEVGVSMAVRNEFWSCVRGEDLVAMLTRVGHGIGLDLDAAHAQVASVDPVALYTELSTAQPGLVKLVHLTDTAYQDNEGQWQNTSPEFPRRRATQVFRDLGQGSVDLPALYQALEKTNFSGWATVSCRQTRDPMRALLRSRHFINTALQAA